MEKCCEIVKKIDWFCGYLVFIVCLVIFNDCFYFCEVMLECGYMCFGICGECCMGCIYK